MMDNQMVDILSSLSEKEKDAVLKILGEYSSSDKSSTMKTLLDEDYEELPVDIDTFLYDPKYLGKGLIDKEGRKTVYPYWVDTLKKIFPDPFKPAQYNTLALTGAIGLGKSFEAVLCGLYELHRMLCLKDPYLYYGLQPIDKITFALMNITLEAAKGVAWDKFQQLAQSSEWFMSHGTVSKSNVPVWTPGKKIELICGSQSRHIIGRAVYWCLDGDTEIATNLGTIKLKDAVDKDIRVYSVDGNGELVLSDLCTVKPTAVESCEYEIELEDGTILKCTPTHRFMLKDGSYKEAQYLTIDDELFDVKKYGYIYKTVNKVNGKIYIGQRKSDKFLGNAYMGSGKALKRSVAKYGKENFEVSLLTWCVSRQDADEMEKYYISLYNSTNTDKGYNISIGGTGGYLGAGVNGNLNKVAITNGTRTRYIGRDEELPDGFRYGNSAASGTHDMSRYYNDKEARIRNSLSKSGKNNSSYGNGYRVSGGRNGHNKYRYTFKGVEYECRKYLVQGLKEQGYDINVNAVRKIENGNYSVRIAKKFKWLIDGLSWRDKNENKINN